MKSIIIVVVLSFLLVLCTGCMEDVDPAACRNDSDCVPAQCCHPTSCINEDYKGPCTELCTAVCEGPIDCGAGRCGCVEGRCRVIPTNSTPG